MVSSMLDGSQKTMPNLLFYLLAGWTALLFIAGLMAQRKAAPYSAAIVLLLVLLIWRHVDPTAADLPAQDISEPEVAKPANPQDRATDLAPHDVDDRFALSLTAQTMDCDGSAQAAITKAASDEDQSADALAAAKAAADTCRGASEKIRTDLSDNDAGYDAIQACGMAMSNRADAMDSLAAMTEGIATQDDIANFKARQTVASQSETTCQSALMVMGQSLP